jgi:RNA polymerase sigma factor (sigma-70 family)
MSTYADDTIPYPASAPHEILSPAAERALLLALAAAETPAEREAAIGTLVNHNQRLVMSIAKRYLGRGMSLMDLHQEGNLGLLHALGKFRPDKTTVHGSPIRLSTYATAWIRQRIERALDDYATVVRLPVHMCEQVARMRRVEAELTLTIGDWPDDAKLAEELGWSAARLAKVRESARIAHTDSLDAPLTNTNGNVYSLLDFVADERDALDDLVERDAQTRGLGLLASLLAELDERERAIVSLRYGLGDTRAQGLEEIGQAYGITRERVRQIERAAMEKLRGVARDLVSQRAA